MKQKRLLKFVHLLNKMSISIWSIILKIEKSCYSCMFCSLPTIESCKNYKKCSNNNYDSYEVDLIMKFLNFILRKKKTIDSSH